MSEHARDVAQAFFELFLNASKRTAEDNSAFGVYAADSIARITRAKEDGATEDVTLNGIDSIAMYNLSLPPSRLTLAHYDALPTHGEGIAILASGTETIDIIDYPWSRTLVLSPTPQGGFYLKSDMLHYDVGVPLASVTTEVIELVVPTEPKVVQKKPRIQNLREKKPRAPRTPVGTTPTEDVITTPVAPVEEVQAVAEPVPEPVVVAVEEPVVVVPVVVAEPEPVVEAVALPVPAPVVVVPAPAPVVTETPQNSTKSWSQLVSGKTNPEPVQEPVPHHREKRQHTKQQAPVETKEAAPAAAAVVETVAEVKQEKKAYAPPQQQVNISNIPEFVTKETLQLALFQYGNVIDLYQPSGKNFAVATFSTAQEASSVVALNVIKVGKATLNLAPKVAKDQGFRSVNKRK